MSTNAILFHVLPTKRLECASSGMHARSQWRHPTNYVARRWASIIRSFSRRGDQTMQTDFLTAANAPLLTAHIANSEALCIHFISFNFHSKFILFSYKLLAVYFIWKYETGNTRENRIWMHNCTHTRHQLHLILSFPLTTELIANDKM